MWVTCAVAALLTVLSWPLSQLGKGVTDDGDAETRLFGNNVL